MPAVTTDSIRNPLSCACRRGPTGYRARAALASWGALLFSAAAIAAGPTQTGAVLSEEEFLGDMPVVLSATRLAQPLSEAPAPVTVIDRETIDASGARDVAELLRLVPGFVVAYENGHRHVVTYHGLSDQFARRLQVLIDGRSVYIPSFGGVPWSDLPLAVDDIERIEVIRGPNAATYGANSFLAIISIITRHAAADRGGALKATIGSSDVRDGLVRLGGGSGDLDYRVTVGYQRDEGFELRNDSREISLLTARADFRASDADDIVFQAGYNGGPRGRGFPDRVFDQPRDQEITSRFQQIRWRHELTSGDEIAVQLYANHHEADEHFATPPLQLPPPYGLTTVPINYDVTSDRYDLEIQHTSAPHSQLRLVWGLGARLDLVEWPLFLGTPDAVENRLYRAFANAEWRASTPLVVNAGLMVETNQITGGDVSPRLAANYHLATGHTLRAGISRAVRTPVVLEEQSDARLCAIPACTIFDQIFLSTGQLRSETITSYEIGYLGRLARGLDVDLRTFHDRVHDLIGFVTRPFPDVDGDVRDFRNSDHVTITGGEARITYQPSRHQRVLLNYAVTDIDGTDIDAPYTISAPRSSLSLLGVQRFGRAYQASLAYYYTGKMLMLDGDVFESTRRLDLRLARRFRGAQSDAEVALVLQHLLGEYAEYRQENIYDHRAYLTLSVRIR